MLNSNLEDVSLFAGDPILSRVGVAGSMESALSGTDSVRVAKL